MELNSRNLGSRCEAVIVVLQGLMSSEVELVPGGMTGDVTGSELAEVCQQSHVSVMGRNNARRPMAHPDGTVSRVLVKLDRGWKGRLEKLRVDMCCGASGFRQ